MLDWGATGEAGDRGETRFFQFDEYLALCGFIVGITFVMATVLLCS